MSDGAHHLLRAVDVDDDPATVYRWLCQLGPVVEVEPGRRITVATAGSAARLFGDLAITWAEATGKGGAGALADCHPCRINAVTSTPAWP